MGQKSTARAEDTPGRLPPEIPRLAGEGDKVFRMNVCVHAQWPSHVQLPVAPWTVACQASLPVKFSRQEFRVNNYSKSLSSSLKARWQEPTSASW